MKGYTGFIKTAYLKSTVKYRTKDFFDKKMCKAESEIPLHIVARKGRRFARYFL